jgi:hypothetical protein
MQRPKILTQNISLYHQSPNINGDHPSPNIEPLSTKHPIFSPIPLPNSVSFAALETLQLVLELQKQMNNV